MQATISEAELLRASQAGDKDAFGSIVERYQCLVCAITYSATGDFARSRKLAKETFVRAFRSLEQLKDPNRFRLMLCRIARNLADRSTRIERFDVVRDCEAKQAAESDTGEIPIGKERQELVWRGLETIPERFREPMVFFHQRDSSQPAAASDLDLSEPALIQYVSKARSLLRPEVASLIQDVLAKTAPGEAFTLAVLEALSKAPEPGKRPVSNLQSQDASNLDYVYLSGPAPMSKSAIYGAFAGGIFGGVAWLLPTSIMAKDWSAAGAVLAVAAAIFVASATLCIRNQAKRWRILGWVMIALCALNLAVINLRWDLWMQAYRNNPSYNAPTNLSRWTLNAIIAAIMAALLAIFLVLDSRQRKQTTEPPQSLPT
ncbi:MAG: sigma-70 family RNA polymerase sigma factor [Sedimentisphaerales bacterium]|nr:sigma-70 family RNA polymerase sigma factor [Sedimentisphaerales bacterium]